MLFILSDDDPPDRILHNHTNAEAVFSAELLVVNYLLPRDANANCTFLGVQEGPLNLLKDCPSTSSHYHLLLHYHCLIIRATWSSSSQCRSVG